MLLMFPKPFTFCKVKRISSGLKSCLGLHPEKITMAEHAEGARVRREDTALTLNNLQFYSASKG